MTFSIRKTGAWALAASILRSGRNIPRALDRATQQEAQFYRTKIIEGLVSQAPGGRALRPLAQSTLMVRRATGFSGTKALIRSGDMMRAVVAQRTGPRAAFVGILRSARGRDGQSLANIAEIQENGAGPIVIMVTAAMRGFLVGVFGGAPAEGSLIIIQIPPRPFIRPVFEAFGGAIGAARFRARVAANMGGIGARLMGGTPPPSRMGRP